ncbi:hypothetical protein ACJEBK_28245 [Peribacillus frigoritolerans]|uniref:hypothetical protein n=1 Tax=Peribacillus frigoritolerans TaxID=450367 RepID=UPI00387190CA
MPKIRIETMPMSINKITIEAEYAGNIAYYRSLSKFESLEAFNAHYRSLTYTYAELLDQKPSFKAILKALFDSAPSTFGVPFMKRETLAEKAGVSLRSVGNFLKVASETFGITTLKQLGKKDKRYGGYAYLVYVFSPLSDLVKYPSDEAIEAPSEIADCTASCTASLHSVEKPETLEPQVVESDILVPNQEFFNHVSPSEIKDFKIISNSEFKMHNVNKVNMDDTRTIAKAYKVPTEVIEVLEPLVTGKEIVSIWKTTYSVIKKAGFKFKEITEDIILAMNRARITFKNGKARKGFAACLIGTVKGVISDLKDASNSFWNGAFESIMIEKANTVSLSFEEVYGSSREEFYGSREDLPF